MKASTIAGRWQGPMIFPSVAFLLLGSLAALAEAVEPVPGPEYALPLSTREDSFQKDPETDADLLTINHRTHGGGEHPEVGWDRKGRQVVFGSHKIGGMTVCVATIPPAWQNELTDIRVGLEAK